MRTVPLACVDGPCGIASSLVVTEWLSWVMLIVVGFFAGGINAVAGGGSLLAFPALLATGLPPLVANVTNSVAQGPGFLGAAVSQRADLTGNRTRLIIVTITAVVGSVIGCVLLLVLPPEVFDTIVPALVGLSAVLIAFQSKLRQWLGGGDNPHDRTALMTGGLFLASVYGGYFGGARSVILIAVLVLTAQDSMRRLNALKSWSGMLGSTATLVVYAAIAPVDWFAVLLLVPTTLLGGFVGGKLAQRLPATVLRYMVVAIAAFVAIYMALD